MANDQQTGNQGAARPAQNQQQNEQQSQQTSQQTSQQQGGQQNQQQGSDFDGLKDKKPEELTPEELRLMADTMPGEGPGD